MTSTNCQELLNIENISHAFKNNKQALSNNIISCFYSCYHSLFVKWAKITYRHYPTDMIEFLSNNSFTDGVMKLKESASRDQLYQSNASVKTILFHYCKNMLLGHLSKEMKLSEKNKKMKVLLSDGAVYPADESEVEMTENIHQRIAQALAKMEPADRQIIQWRHIEEKSNDEIARLLAITVPSATNRIYRCMQRLRDLIDHIDKNEL